jgi:DNA repair protein SbcC/Rad50
MKNTIERLKLQNFKGAKDLEIEFNKDGVTNIYGPNASLKTTIFDAFCWLLTEKDSMDRKAFEIKTLNKDNTPINRLTHSVEGVISNDGFKTTLKREYTEKWQKKRGEEEAVFTGHETNHFVNNIPVTKKEYCDVVNKIIPETLLKLISNPFYFPSLKWEEKRKIVLQIAGEPTLEKVAKGVTKYEELLALIDSSDFEMWKRKIKADIKDKKKELADIEPRINELQNSIVDDMDINRLEADKDLVQAEIEAVNSKIHAMQQTLIEKTQAVRQQINEAEDAIRAERGIWEASHAESTKALRDEVRELSLKHDELTYELEQAHKGNLTLTHSMLMERRQELLKTYNTVNAQDFQIKENDIKCYACGQELPNVEGMVETKKADFLKAKQEQLEKIKKEGVSVADEVKKVQAEMAGKLQKGEKIKIELQSLSALLETKRAELRKADAVTYKPTDKEQSLKVTLEDLKEKLNALLNAAPDNAELKQRLTELDTQRQEIIKQIATAEGIETTRKRIKQLMASEKKIASEIAKLEKLEYLADGLTKRKITMMDKDIRAKFNGVQFKMYRELINGGEEPTCEILVNGVPFDNANHAAQINTGIRIINALSSHYSISAPIFVDNAEAVNTIEPTESQLIRLVVVEPGFTSDNGIVLKPLK